MKNYCKIVFMCMQVGVLFGAQRLETQDTKGARRRSPVRPPEKIQTTSERTVPIPMTRSAEIRIEEEETIKVNYWEHLRLMQLGEQGTSPRTSDGQALSPYFLSQQAISPDSPSCR